MCGLSLAEVLLEISGLASWLTYFRYRLFLYFMAFRQTREYGAFDLSYILEYDINGSEEGVSGTLTVDAGEIWHQVDESPSYEFVDGLEGELETQTADDQRLELAINVQYPDITSSGKLLLDITDVFDMTQEKLHIKFPSIYLLKLYHRLLQDEVPIQAHDQLNDILNEKQPAIDLNDVLNSAPFAVSRQEYFRLHDRVAAYDPSLTDDLNNIIVGEFSDWIRSKGVGKYYPIDSVGELQELVEEYNSQENTPTVPLPVLDSILKSREEHIGRGLDGFLIENFGSLDFPYSDLSLQSFVLAIGHLAKELDTDHLTELLATHSGRVAIVENLDDCLDEYGDTQVNCFRSQVPNFAEKGDIEAVRYGTARLIRRYLIDVADSFDHSTQAYLYGSIVSLTADSPAVWLAEHARHHRHLKLAEDARGQDSDRALKHYDQAIISLTQAESWNPSPNEHMWAVFRKTLHEAETLADDGLYEAAANKLAEREELIQEIGDSTDSSFTDELIDALNGHQHELRAEKYLAQDQFERAKELYNQAAGDYRRADRDELFRGVKGRELQIDALLAEISGEFERAADFHQEYAETLPDSAGSKFHLIRQDICLAKSAAMEQEYQKARKQLNEIEPKYNITLNPSQQQFGQLLEAAQHFRQDESDEIENHLESLIASLGDDEDRLLDFSDDYTTGHLTVLAAQRLLSLPVEKQTLTDLIDIAIKDACYPKAPEERISGPEKTFASPTVGESREWELSLPSHIINHLDQLRIDKQTTFDEYASLVRQLAVITEELLRILWEYHAKQYWGGEWRSQVPGTGTPTIGDLYQFFKSDAGNELNAASDVIQLFETEIVGEKLIKELRDALAHGRNPNVTSDTYRQINEEQFDQIYEAVTDVFRVSTTDLPVLGLVDSQLSMNTFKISLQWGGLPKQIWITTEHELEKGELYFFPRSEFDRDYERTVTLSANTIERCEGDTRTHFIQD